MEAVGQRRDPKDCFLTERIHYEESLISAPQTRVDGSVFTGLEETEVVKNVKTFVWTPGKGKGLAEDVMEEETDTSEVDSESDEEVLKSHKLSTDTAITDIKSSFQYEEEDWDKELAESENNNHYDFEDVIHCESFLNQDPATSCSTPKRPLYDPSLHHALSLTSNLVQMIPVDGQFDDAID